MTEAMGDRPFDADALRQRYAYERDKRLRADGNDQYQNMAGAFAHFLHDPYVERVARPALHDDVDVIVIGGGFGGLLAGARLRQAGVASIRIVEKGGDFGGTWYWNRYPGAMCDVESYIYLPLLEELNYVPKQKYTEAPEILAHSRAIGEHFDLYRDACFQTEVTELRWDDDAARWTVSTDRGDAMLARFVVMASGPLHRPKLPGIAGIESFAGHSFHTSRWDYAYTGGGPEGGLDRLAAKRVGIIGTGATAVQVVPHVGAAAAQLYVFQRTPSSIDVRDNRPTDPAWAAALEPGWHQHRMDNFNALVSGVYQPEDLVSDGWTDIIGKLLIRIRNAEPAGPDRPAPDQPGSEQQGLDAVVSALELADFDKMNEIRARVDTIVNDPVTAEALKPYYRQFCKRPCFHDAYLQTYNRPNVTLVDTDGRGVDRVTERGVVVGEREYELDCLIFATGFEVGTDYAHRAGCQIIGRGGLTLTEKWASGIRTLHGMHTRDFPNLLIFSPAQAGFTINFPHALNEQAHHAAYIVRHALDHGVDVVETSRSAEDEWVAEIKRLAFNNLAFLEACTPGYYNNEGRPSERAFFNSFYGGGSIAFFKILDEWRADGTLRGLELSAASA